MRNRRQIVSAIQPPTTLTSLILDKEPFCVPVEKTASGRWKIYFFGDFFGVSGFFTKGDTEDTEGK